MNTQQITYQVIINYLSTKNKNSCNTEGFPTKENILVNSIDFPKRIKKFFNKNYFRYGILNYDLDHNNISFYSSLLTCLDDSFVSLNQPNKLQFIKILKDKIKNDYNTLNLYKKFNYKDKFGIGKEIIYDEINNNLSVPIIQLVADYFNLNIIVFNFENHKKYAIYREDIFNSFKPTLILGYADGYYEPIITNKKRFLRIMIK